MGFYPFVAAGPFLPLSGGTLTGPLTTAGITNSTNPITSSAPISTSGLQSVSASGAVNAAIGNVDVQTAGSGLRVAEGANAKQGVATLAGGTVTVANTSVTANSRIFLTVQSLGTVAVASGYAVTARVVGTSFTITASVVTDTSVIAWEIFEPG